MKKVDEKGKNVPVLRIRAGQSATPGIWGAIAVIARISHSRYNFG
jgi:hypothetical protein